MSKDHRGQIGVCKLTKESGRFVDSHILPKALTRADGLKQGLAQLGRGQTERRWSSWYDSALVIEAGEKILSDYDNWAIAMLRKHKLVWSGWGPMQALIDIESIAGTPWGIRRIEFENGEELKRLRLFLLSILWRAAVTRRREFDEVKLPTDDLEHLRTMVLKQNPEPLDFYPSTLTQLSTLGIRHNHTPIALIKQIPAIGGKPPYEEPVFRFFLDGLIVHFSRLSKEKNAALDLGPLRVGAANSVIINTVRWENSAQAQNLAIVATEAALGRPLGMNLQGPFSSKRKMFE